jgi:hypothetical protein
MCFVSAGLASSRRTGLFCKHSTHEEPMTSRANHLFSGLGHHPIIAAATFFTFCLYRLSQNVSQVMPWLRYPGFVTGM